MQNINISPARICCIGNNWLPNIPGGLERYTYELVLYLSSQHDEIELFVVDLPEVYPGVSVKLKTLGESTSSFLRGLWDAHHSFRTRKMIRPDAFNFHFAYYAFPVIMSLPPKVPITFTFHGPWASEAKKEGLSAKYVWLMYWIERYVYHRCDRFIVLSKAFANLLHEQYKVPWYKIHIIPGGVDIEHFQPNLTRQQARAQLNWSQDRLILFIPRRLCKRMGLEELLIALVQVKQLIPNIWLVIAGKGPLRENLEAQVHELELDHQVHFMGYIPDDELPIAYQAADLTVVPSQALEGFGLILVESLACGTPVLCTPVGGMPEVVEPLCPHLIACSTDASAITNRLIEILTGNLELPSRDQCREYVVKNFDWKVILPKVRQILLR